MVLFNSRIGEKSMAKLDKPYLKLLKKIRGKGTPGSNRTGIMTLRSYGEQIKYDISENVPFLTTKRVWPKGVFEELAWFLRGETCAKSLEDKGVNIWREWGDPVTREMGPIYGKQWRNYGGVDQIVDLVMGLKRDPYSRRHILMAWNPPEIKDMALPPCHCLSQYIVDGTTLHGVLYQRSGDMFLGVPFNSASYSSLMYLFCEMTGLKPGTLTHCIGDAHIYTNHLDQVDLQLSREPRKSPTLKIDLSCYPRIVAANYDNERYRANQIMDGMDASVFQLNDYFPDMGIKAPVAV